MDGLKGRIFRTDTVANVLIAAATGDAVDDAGEGSPNLLLYVEPLPESPTGE